MESRPLKVVWTDPAKNDLQKIYDYLSEISIIVAEKQIYRIMDRVDLLEQGFTQIGQQEPLLKNHHNKYRYLVQDNYKLIYHQIGLEIVIDMVFDTRQNPEKLSRQIIS